MANRRMFSNRIANSAKFLQMPSEAQLLYFHLVLRADDDGVVESYPIMRLLGLATDNFKVLLAKQFIKVLNEDQVIVIEDWLEHNTIRADRKVDSIYKALLPASIKTIEAKPRSDVDDNSRRLGGQSTDGISKGKLGKVKLNKLTLQAEDKSSGKDINDFIEMFKPINPTYSKLFKMKNQRKSCENLLKIRPLKEWESVVKFIGDKIGDRYCPRIATPSQLEDKYANLVAYGSSLKTSGDKNKIYGL